MDCGLYDLFMRIEVSW